MSAEALGILTPQRLDSLPARLRLRPEVQALAYAVGASGSSPGPRAAAVTAAGRRAYVERLGRTLEGLRALDELLPHLRSAGIRPVPTKGGLLCRTHYGDPGARPMADVDLVCLPVDAPLASALLLDRGFRPLPQSARRERLGLVHDLRFKRGQVLVELHHRLWHELGMAGDVSALVARATEVPFGPGTALAPAPADHLWLVLVHAATHGFTGNPLWLTDAALLAGSSPAAWTGVWELASATGSALPVAAACDHLRTAFPDLVPPLPPALARVAPARRLALRGLAPGLQRGEGPGSLWRSRLARTLLIEDAESLAAWLVGKGRLAAAGREA